MRGRMVGRRLPRLTPDADERTRSETEVRYRLFLRFHFGRVLASLTPTLRFIFRQRPRSRPISSFMISFVPAQILWTRASRQARATRYSFMKP